MEIIAIGVDIVEVSRIKNAIAKNDRKEAKSAYERAFELLDMTIEHAPNKYVMRELLRFREVLAQFYLKEYEHPEALEKLIWVLASLNKKSYRVLY